MPNPDNFYVYVHTRDDSGAVFYVGKGRGKRHMARDGRNILWSRIVNKAGFSSHIIADKMNEVDAFSFEKDVIRLLKFLGENPCNMTDGGEGPAGRVFSEKTKTLMREAKLGKSLSSAHKKKISAALTGRNLSSLHIDKLRSKVNTPETRAKMSNAQKGHVTNRESMKKVWEANRNRVHSQEERDRRSLALSGSGNPNFDPTLFNFYHPVSGEVVCTMYDLRTTHGLPSVNLARVVKGERKSVMGWRVMKRVISNG